MTMEFQFHSVEKLFETQQLLFQSPPSTEKLAVTKKTFQASQSPRLQKIYPAMNILKFLGNDSLSVPATHMEGVTDRAIHPNFYNASPDGSGASIKEPLSLNFPKYCLFKLLWQGALIKKFWESLCF